MRRRGRALKRRYGRAKWSAKVKERWHSPAGLFTRPAHIIASELRHASDSVGQAVKRLTFYVNRAGSNLSAATRGKLRHAKRLLEGRA